MSVTLAASEEGLKIFEQARIAKGWNKTVGKNSPWSECHITKATLERFHKRERIKHENFVAICLAVEIDDWERIAALTEIVKTEAITPPESKELDTFSQQIFDWFRTLRFEIEGDPKCDRNYVEAVIRVRVRSGFDRVLVQIIFHQAGLSDLDGFRQAVGDPHQQVDGGWLITKSWVSQAVKDALKESGDRRLTCLTFDELIDQDANFTPYLDWLQREISKREIDRYYVDLGCTKGEFDADTRTLRGTSKYSVAEGGIDRYIDRWLENPVTEHVSILGEFGTGKTWFAFHYAGKCLQAYQEAKSKGMPRPRLPLVIPLRDYAKALNVENVLAGFFYTQHNIRLNSDVFDRLNRMGKLLLIFDGFDEMAERIDTQKMTDNFWELAKVVTTNAKVILTCRTEHFPTAQDGRDNLSGERIPSNVNKIAVAPKFETLELMKFDDKQIRAALSRRTNLATVELVMANSQLLDLLRRAVMAEFVLEALPEIEAGKPIDLARVYLYAVRHKMERDITTGRTFTSLADKLYFLCELAWEMLSEDKMSINYREFPYRLRVLFKNEVKEQKHLDHWHYDMMGQTMLIRNDDGDYSPAHRSLLEFFVAYKLAAELGLLADDFLEMAKAQSGIDESLTPQFYTWSEYWQRDVDEKGERKLIAPMSIFRPESIDKLGDTFARIPLKPTMNKMLLPMLNWDKNDFILKELCEYNLLKLVKSTKRKLDIDAGYLGGNAATILVALNPYSLISQDLSETNLACANFINANLTETNLSGANLENCLTTRVFGAPNVIIMSKDDKQFITAHDDNSIRIWDRSGRELYKFSEHNNHVHCLSLNQNGHLLYSGSDDGTVKEWNLANSICQYTFEAHQDWVRTIALSNDGQFLYSGGSDGTIKEWRIAEGIIYQQTFESHQDRVNTIALSADGKLLYSGSNDGTIKEWDIVDGICIQTFEGHQDGVSAILLSADGKLLYSGSDDTTIKEWRIDDGICQKTFEGHQNWVRTIALNIDNKMLYSGSGDLMIKEWRIADGICQRTFKSHQDRVSTIALSVDGENLYSGSYDRTIKEWKIADSVCQQTIDSYQDWVRAIALSTDGKSLYSGSHDRTIKQWNINDGTYQQTFEGHQDLVRAIALSADGEFLYSGSHDCTIKQWNIDDGICQQTFEGHQDWIMTIALSLDGKILYSGSDDRTVKEWDIVTGKCLHTFEAHQDWVRVIVLSTDGKFLYSGSGDRTIKKWDVLTRKCLLDFVGHQNSLMAIALSPDGELLYSGSDDRTIREWDVATGKCLHIFEAHQDWVRVIALSSDGKFLYSGSGDRTIKKWDVLTRKCLHTFEGHQDWVRAITLSTDGKFLYSGSDDRTINVWDVATGECLRTIDPRLCAGANITNVKGLTPAQTDSLLALGAFDNNRK
jgi:WD40 repeat protein